MKKFKRIAFILMIILGFLLVIYGIYNLTLSNKSRMLNALDKYLNNKIENIENDELRKFKIETNTSIQSTNQESETLQEKIKGDMYFDASIEKSYIKLLYSLPDINLNVELLKDKNDAYFKIKEIKDIFYKISNSLNEKNINNKQIKEFIVNTLRDNLDENNFEKSNSEIKINGTSIKTDIYSVNVSCKDLNNIIKDLKKEFQLDDKLFSSITENIKDSTKMFTYSIYIDENKNIVKQELLVPVQFDNSKDQVNFVLDIEDYEKDDLKYSKLNMSFLSMDIINYEIKETKKDSYSLSGTINLNNQILKFSGIINDSKIDISCFLNKKKVAYLSITNEVIEKNKEYLLDINIVINDIIDINSQNKILFNVEIPDVDISKSIEYENMSEEELNVFKNFINSFLN